MSVHWRDNYSIKATLSKDSQYESQYLVEDIQTHDIFLLREINITNEEHQRRFKNEITCLRAIQKQLLKSEKIFQDIIESSQTLNEKKQINININSYRSLEQNAGYKNYIHNNNKENNKELLNSICNSYQNLNNNNDNNKNCNNKNSNSIYNTNIKQSQELSKESQTLLLQNTIMQITTQSRYLPQLLKELPAESIYQRILLQNQTSLGQITLSEFLKQHKQSPQDPKYLSTRKTLHYFLQMINAKAFMHSIQIYALFTNLDSFVYSNAMDAFVINNFQNTTADIDSTQEYFKELERKDISNNSQNSQILHDNYNNNSNNDKDNLITTPQQTSFYSPQQLFNMQFSPELNEIYALGGILYFMLFGCVYTFGNREKLERSYVPQSIKDILQSMLQPQENLRPSLVEVAKTIEKELSPFFGQYSQLVSDLPNQQESKEFIQNLSKKKIGLVGVYKKSKINNNNNNSNNTQNWGQQQQRQQQQQQQYSHPTNPFQLPTNGSNILRNSSNIGQLGDNMTESFPRGQNSNVTMGNDMTYITDQASWIQGCQGGGLDSASYNQTLSDSIISFSKHMEIIDGFVDEQQRKYMEIKEQLWQQQQQQQQQQQLPITTTTPQLQQSRSIFKKLSFIQFYLNKLLQFLTQSAISYILLKEQSIIDDSNNFLLQSMKQAAKNHQSDINSNLNFEVLRNKAKQLAWQQPMVVNTINCLLGETDNPTLDLNYFMTLASNNNNSNLDNTLNNNNNNNSNNNNNNNRISQTPSFNFQNRSTVGIPGRSSLGAQAEQASRLYQFNTRNPNNLLSEFIKHSHVAFQMGDRKQFNSFLVAVYKIGKYFEKDQAQSYSEQLGLILQDIYAKTKQLFFERSDTDSSTIVLRSNMYYASQIK